jgi:hypothetical protein
MTMSTNRLLALFSLVAISGVLAGTTPAAAITFGALDGQQHPYVGTMLADADPNSPGLDVICSGTLIADPVSKPVFLTAAHCTSYLEWLGITRVWVTFAPGWDEDSSSTDGAALGLIGGSYVTNPLFAGGNAGNPSDIAVVLLDSAPAGVTPARLPSAGLLDALASDHTLVGQQVTTVGYGCGRELKQKGPGALFCDTQRRAASESALSVHGDWLHLSQNPATGDGGSCFGDSGGPHFLGDETSNLVVSTSVSGDRFCRASDQSFRLDTGSARDFLRAFVSLP